MCRPLWLFCDRFDNTESHFDDQRIFELTSGEAAYFSFAGVIGSSVDRTLSRPIVSDRSDARFPRPTTATHLTHSPYFPLTSQTKTLL